jgi:ATP-dependent Clp protease ATP-binding subunit ClpA
MRRRARRRATRSALSRPAPIVADLLVRAGGAAAALRHDSIGTEHVLVALVADEGSVAGDALRRLGLEPGTVRADVVRIAGEGPPPGAAFDADALHAIGIDLAAVRARVDETFGEGALDRAQRAQGRCGAAGFGVAPGLKRAFEDARCAADGRHAELGHEDILLAICHQRDSVAARILDDHGIGFERLRRALAAGRDSAA